jgi:hypothetical protein
MNSICCNINFLSEWFIFHSVLIPRFRKLLWNFSTTSTSHLAFGWKWNYHVNYVCMCVCVCIYIYTDYPFVQMYSVAVHFDFLPSVDGIGCRGLCRCLLKYHLSYWDVCKCVSIIFDPILFILHGLHVFFYKTLLKQSLCISTRPALRIKWSINFISAWCRELIYNIFLFTNSGYFN